jgi:uncharacterized protein (DUF433 family)
MEAVAQRPPVAVQEAILAVVPVRPHARIFERAIRPRYNFAEAGRILERKAETLRRWSIGHDRVYRGEPRTDPPLIIIDGVADEGGPPLSFLNLIELRFLTSWRDSMPLHLIREALAYSAEHLGTDRPLLDLDFQRQGRDMFVEYGADLLTVTRGGQLAWPGAVDALFKSLDYDTAEQAAYRWWPLGRDRPVLLDTRINGGRPTAATSGVRTIAIASRLREGWKPAEVAEETTATLDEIKAAAQIESLKISA